MEESSIRILIVEDSEDDALLMIRELDRIGIPFEHCRVENAQDFEQTYQNGRWDVILTDYALPSFSALDVMTRVHQSGRGTPIIIVSGVIGEDRAVECMRMGASDYLLKDRLARLGPAVLKVLDRSQLQVAKRKAEKKVRESEKQYRGIFEAVGDPLLVINTSSIICDVNPSACKTYRISRSSFLGRSVKDIVHPSWHDRYIEVLDAIKKSEMHTVETLHQRSDKSSFPAEVRISPFTYGDEEMALIIVRDISERKKAQQLIQESVDTYKRFFQEDITGDFILTPNGEISAFNPAYMRMFGFETEGEVHDYDHRSLFVSRNDWDKILQSLASEQKLEYVSLLMRKVKGGKLHVIANIFGERDFNGDLVSIHGYLFDDTTRRLLEEQLIQANKLESLGTLAGGIAHDFNNILAIVMGHASLMLDPETGGGHDQTVIQTILKATKRGAGIVKQLLMFARKTELKLQSIDVNQAIADIVDLLSETIPKTIVIQQYPGEQLAPIRADVTQFEQVLLNLCVNARDAMPGGGELRLSSSHIPGEKLREEVPRAAADDYICIQVADTGAGMDEETQSRIFEPFFTTKEEEQGTGMGLAIAFGIVENHGGHILVESDFGSGTTFNVYFPVGGVVETKEKQTTPAGIMLPGGDETILLVEDEPMIAEFVSTTLEMKGYTVLVAEDGEAAIDIFSTYGSDIPLVLSDLGLPKMPGDILVKQLSETSPELKVILASGFFEPRVHKEFESDSRVYFMQKPYTPQELLRTVRQFIDS